jgi:hypothetical protein
VPGAGGEQIDDTGAEAARGWGTVKENTDYSPATAQWRSVKTIGQGLSLKAAEQDALWESTLKGAKSFLPVAYRALKGPVYLPLRGKTRERA